SAGTPAPASTRTRRQARVGSPRSTRESARCPLRRVAGRSTEGSTVLLRNVEHVAPRLSFTGMSVRFGKTSRQLGAVPGGNFVGLQRFRQAVPDLLDQVEPFSHAEAIDAQYFDGNAH